MQIFVTVSSKNRGHVEALFEQCFTSCVVCICCIRMQKAPEVERGVTGKAFGSAGVHLTIYLLFRESME